MGSPQNTQFQHASTHRKLFAQELKVGKIWLKFYPGPSSNATFQTCFIVLV